MSKQTSLILLRLGFNRGWIFKLFSNPLFYTITTSYSLFIYLFIKVKFWKNHMWFFSFFIFFTLVKCIIHVFFWKAYRLKKKKILRFKRVLRFHKKVLLLSKDLVFRTKKTLNLWKKKTAKLTLKKKKKFKCFFSLKQVRLISNRFKIYKKKLNDLKREFFTLKLLFKKTRVFGRPHALTRKKIFWKNLFFRLKLRLPTTVEFFVTRFWYWYLLKTLLNNWKTTTKKSKKKSLKKNYLLKVSLDNELVGLNKSHKIFFLKNVLVNKVFKKNFIWSQLLSLFFSKAFLGFTKKFANFSNFSGTCKANQLILLKRQSTFNSRKSKGLLTPSLRFYSLANRKKDTKISIAQRLYLIWNANKRIKKFSFQNNFLNTLLQSNIYFFKKKKFRKKLKILWKNFNFFFRKKISFKKKNLFFQKPRLSFSIVLKLRKKKLKKLKLKFFSLSLERDLYALIPNLKCRIHLYNIRKVLKKSAKRVRLEKSFVNNFILRLPRRSKIIFKKGKFSLIKLSRLVGWAFKLIGLSRLLAHYLSLKVKSIKTHWALLKAVGSLLEYYILNYIHKIIGCRVSLAGKINNSLRTRKYVLSVGCVNQNCFDSIIDYAQADSFSLAGTFSLRIWIQFNKKK